MQISNISIIIRSFVSYPRARFSPQFMSTHQTAVSSSEHSHAIPLMSHREDINSFHFYFSIRRMPLKRKTFTMIRHLCEWMLFLASQRYVPRTINIINTTKKRRCSTHLINIVYSDACINLQESYGASIFRVCVFLVATDKYNENTEFLSDVDLWEMSLFFNAREYFVEIFIGR